MTHVITEITSEDNKILIETMISMYGSSAEHNYHCYLDKINEFCKTPHPYVFVLEGYKGILAKYDTTTKEYRVFMEVLAPQAEKAEVFLKFLEHIYSEGSVPKKVWVEFEDETRSAVLEILKDSKYRCNRINYELIWPVFDMSLWNGDMMQGGEWKDLRYYWKKFFKDHNVEFVDATDAKADPVALKDMVHKWKKQRTVSDHAQIDYYLTVIDSGFQGYDVTRIMLVDGKIGAITAGFYSRPGYYYSSIGLYNPEISRCNDIANMDDLINLKRLGCKIVDFGGIEEEHLDFKKKFRPTRYYKTSVFSIVLKES
ncbi:MAG: GNAT family N-acetyltransferase [Candidatus Woesearchaeota archaeon]